MDSSEYNLAPPDIRSMWHNATSRYTALARPDLYGSGLYINRLRPSDLAATQRSYQLANFGFWDPSIVYTVPNATDLLPDPSFPRDIYGLNVLVDQFTLADPADQITPRAKVRPPRSAWTGVCRRRRNL